MLMNLSERVRNCYKRAEECGQRAKSTKTTVMREEYLRLERSWLVLARSIQSEERLQAFNATLPKLPPKRRAINS